MMITQELLYDIFQKEDADLFDFISATTDSILLHMIAGNYNWDDGFEVPQYIIQNINCDLGTALMIFELAEGYILYFEELEKKRYSTFLSFRELISIN